MLRLCQCLAVLAVAVVSAAAKHQTTNRDLDELAKAPHGCAVEQIHLAQGTTPADMMVMWVTGAASASKCEYYATQYKDAATHLMHAEGSADTYKSNNGRYVSGQLHEVLLQGLEADTEYTYRCGDAEKAECISTERTFTTLPLVGDLGKAMTFAVIGDLGVTKDSGITVDHCISNEPDMILHAGDLSYANCNQFIWDKYGRLVEPLSSSLPWMVCAGNHEIEFSPATEAYPKATAFTAFEARYRMPRLQPAEFGDVTIPCGPDECTPSVFQMEYNYGNSFYSFESGMVHVTVLNCYSTSDHDSVQYKWAEKDFQGVNRKKTPWLAVIMHCPWYNTNTAHQQEEQTLDMKRSMESLFYQYSVNIAFQGHVHAYERSFPVFEGNVDSKGTIYITIGDGGNKEGHAEDYVQPTPDWSAYRNGTQYGHGIFTVYNSTVAQWDWNRNNDGIKVIADSAVLRI